MTRSIYVIRSASGPVKIGIASIPRRRLSGLRTGSAVHLFMDYAMEVHDGDAAKVEKRAHEILHKHRLNGEWFGVESSYALSAVLQSARELGFRLVHDTSVSDIPNRAGSPPNDKIFQMRTSEAFLTLLDNWRRSQPEIPSRAEAVRILVERAIHQDKGATN